jgi:hypothetical protein
MKFIVSSIFSEMRIQDFSLGIMVFFLTGVMINTLDWNMEQEVFYGSAVNKSNTLDLEIRVQELEQELQILKYNK